MMHNTLVFSKYILTFYKKNHKLATAPATNTLFSFAVNIVASFTWDLITPLPYLCIVKMIYL